MTLGGLFGSSSHSQIERSSMRKEEAINPSKRSVYRGKKTQKLLIRTDFAPSFHAATKMKCDAKISQFCLHLLAKM